MKWLVEEVGLQTARRLLCLQTMTMNSENAGISKQLGCQEIWQCVIRCVCHSHLMWRL